MKLPEQANHAVSESKPLPESTRLFLLGFLAGVLFLPVLIGLAMMSNPSRSSPADESHYHRIVIGQTLDEVGKLFAGEGIRLSRDEHPKGHVHPSYIYENQAAERSDAAFFVEWWNREDGNIRYRIGFDADKKVVFKARFLRS